MIFLYIHKYEILVYIRNVNIYIYIHAYIFIYIHTYILVSIGLSMRRYIEGILFHYHVFVYKCVVGLIIFSCTQSYDVICLHYNDAHIRVYIYIHNMYIYIYRSTIDHQSI